MESRRVDIAILTPLVEEWEEMVKHLTGAIDVTSWSPAKRGSIGAHSILCAVTGKGQEEASSALTHVLERARPSVVILMGIAGGFPAFKIHRGDVVVAHTIHSFDYGKLVNGKFIRRPENDYNCDRRLLEFANLVARSENADWQSHILQPRPDVGTAGRSIAHTDCYIASSNKVVDDPSHEFYARVASSFPEIHAVETEAVGAGASVRLAQSERQLGLLVIRGISDEPGAPRGSGSAHRRQWMRYAAAAAAAFTRSFIERLPQRNEGPEAAEDRHRRNQEVSQGSADAIEQYCRSVARQFSTIHSLGYEAPRLGQGAYRERAMDTAFVPLMLSETGPIEGFSIGPPQQIDEIMKLTRRLMVRGLPGSGKTTILRHLAHETAAFRLANHAGLVPVYVRLHGFHPVNWPLLDLIRATVADHTMSAKATDAIFAEGHLLGDQSLLLFDGVDEIAGTVDVKELIGQLESLAHSHPYTHIIVASRPVRDDLSGLTRYRIFDLMPLGAESIDSYVRHWAHDSIEVASQVKTLLAKNARLAALASSPFLLTMICTAVELNTSQDLIRNRSDLYRTCTEALLGRLYDKERRGSLSSTVSEAVDILKDVAYRFFLWQEPDFPAQYVNVIGTRAVRGQLERTVESLLDQVQQVSGLVHRSGDSFTFAHKTLWEYFAALTIMEKDIAVTLQNANNPGWEEVIRLSAGLRAATPEGATDMVQRLWSVNRPLALRASAEIQLADFLIKDLAGGDRVRAKSEKLLLLDALEQSLPLFSKTDQIAMIDETVALLLLHCEESDAEVVYRAEELLRHWNMPTLEAGGIIHQLLQLNRADERRNALALESAAHLSWIDIEGGEFWMGEDQHMFNERPARRVTVRGFQMAKHPVTNRMLKGFQLVAPETISCGTPSRPAVALTWYEARYFAIWLGCRLPQEAEWEYAARGGKHSVRAAYFFGDDKNDLRNHAWFNEPDATEPHAVDEINPYTKAENLNPLAIANILGNVWEWCDDVYSNPLAPDGSSDGPQFHTEGMMSGERVMRGGSFRGSADTLRCARRVFASPRSRGSTVGFRLVYVPQPQGGI